MNELLTQTGAILGQATELLKNPAISGAVTGLFTFLKSKFNGKSAQEKLALIEQNRHDEKTIVMLQGNLEDVLNENESLQNELAEKLKEIEKLMKENGVQPTVSNKISINGEGNIAYQNIHNSTISDNSARQTHHGSGDNVGRDKITRKDSVIKDTDDTGPRRYKT